MTNTWFRSWHGAPTDNKWLVVARRAGTTPGVVSAVFWALLDHASQADERGSVADFDTETYAEFSGFDYPTVLAILQAMAEKGVIADGRLSSWEKRQPKREDDSTPRVQRHRSGQSVTAGSKPIVTHGNAAKHNVTLEEKREDPDPEEEEEYAPMPSSSSSLAPAPTPSPAPNPDQDAAYAAVVAMYEQNIGLVTSITSDDIKAAIEQFPVDWIRLGLELAVKNEKRSWGYVAGCLRNWKTEGFGNDRQRAGAAGFKGATTEEREKLKGALKRAKQGIATAENLGFEPQPHDLATIEKAKKAGLL